MALQASTAVETMKTIEKSNGKGEAHKSDAQWAKVLRWYGG